MCSREQVNKFVLSFKHSIFHKNFFEKFSVVIQRGDGKQENS